MSRALGARYCSLLVVRDGQLWGDGRGRAAAGLRRRDRRRARSGPTSAPAARPPRSGRPASPTTSARTPTGPTSWSWPTARASAPAGRCRLLGPTGVTLATFATYSAEPVHPPRSRSRSRRPTRRSSRSVSSESAARSRSPRATSPWSWRSAPCSTCATSTRRPTPPRPRGSPPRSHGAWEWRPRAATRSSRWPCFTTSASSAIPTEILKSPRPAHLRGVGGDSRQHPVIGERILSRHSPTSGRSRRRYGTSTSAGTGRAIPTGWPGSRSRRPAASCSRATPGTP